MTPEVRTMARCIAVLVLVLAGWAVPRLQAQAQDAASDADIVTAAVELDGIELFRVRGVSAFPAATRARLINERLAAIAADATVPAESLRLVAGEDAIRIVADTRPVLGVVEADAALEQVSRADLASAQLLRLTEAIRTYRVARTPEALWGAAARTAVATVVLVLAVAVVVWLSRRLDALLRRWLQPRIQSVGIQSFEVMRAERIWATLRSAVVGVRTVLVGLSALVYLGYVLGQWPWTRGMARDLVGFVLAPLQVIGRGVVANIPSLVFLVVLLFTTRLILRLVRLFFDAVQRGSVVLKGFEAEWAEPTYKIARVGVVAFALVVAYPYIPGSGTDAFKGVSLFLGVVFSLGSSSAIANVIAGYMMTYRRAFKLGDVVKIGDAFGEVVETRLQVTHLRTIKNEEIVIPNSQILGTDVRNYSSLARQRGLILHTEVGIGYETPWRQVDAMLLAAAERTAGVERDPRPFVHVKKLGDFAVTYELNAWCRDVKTMAATYTALHRQILDVFNEYGVQIMTPAYETDPPTPKVVPPAEWYATPAIRPADVPDVASAGAAQGQHGSR